MVSVCPVQPGLRAAGRAAHPAAQPHSLAALTPARLSSPDYETIRNGGLIFAVVAFVIGLLVILSECPGWAGAPGFCSLCQALAGRRGGGAANPAPHMRGGHRLPLGPPGKIPSRQAPNRQRVGKETT